MERTALPSFRLASNLLNPVPQSSVLFRGRARIL